MAQDRRAARALAQGEYGVQPLARDTLQERVYNQLAGLILDGGIAPGQLVTIQGLAEAFEVSTMPVREALKRLTAANALTVVSGRSIGIPPLTRERFADLRAVRLEMEGTAAAWAATRIEAATLGELERMVGEMQATNDGGDVTGYLRGNRAFHFAVYRASGSAVLVALIEILWLQISPYFNLLHTTSKSDSIRHHRNIIAALRRRDADGARAALVGDIDAAYALLATMLK